jgi:hypothetical protein
MDLPNSSKKKRTFQRNNKRTPRRKPAVTHRRPAKSKRPDGNGLSVNDQLGRDWRGANISFGEARKGPPVMLLVVAATAILALLTCYAMSQKDADLIQSILDIVKMVFSCVLGWALGRGKGPGNE